MPESSPAAAAFGQLHFRYPFRKYQQMVLDMVARQSDGDGKYHIVSPPGSGKTIIGLELIRRFGCPAVVFVPTTTIQKQWQDKVGMFTDAPAWLRDHTSLDPRNLAEINILTYQSLSTPGENLAFVEETAVEWWVDDLLTSDQTGDEEEACRRIALMRVSNPHEYRREVARRYRRIKRELLQRAEFDGRRFLHPNARDLIDRIVALGTGTVVLDECHHLLDYWAFILRELVKALPGVRVIGLTATLPDPQNVREYENYTSLLGEVDFDVPTPAVITEGNLAPFRDLVFFCRPSQRELEYLHEIQGHLEAAVARVTETPAFWHWIQHAIVDRHAPSASQGEQGPAEPASEPEPFETFFEREPALAIAGVKYLWSRNQPLPADISLVEEMLQPVAIDDWLTLLERFGLQALKISPLPEQQALYRQLRQALLPFGVSITERGVRQQRSPGDLILALSESKDQAVAEILRAEAGALGDRLRAVVITDFERLSARSRRLRGVLDPDAGSAVRIYHHLIADLQTNELNPVLVTGKVVLVDSDIRAAVDAAIRHWAEENHTDLTWEWRATGSPWMDELRGHGRDWSPRTYVRLMTGLLDRGVTRCLVGTRGILGEGWDAVTLNTLVDLTSVTTATGVRQIRGRVLRLDPSWPHKVAHNWDVVCVSTDFDRGDTDLRRFVARHRHTWGMAGAAGQEASVVRGVAHVDPDLAQALDVRPFDQLDYERYSRRALEAVEQRDTTYRRWNVGRVYQNLAFSVSKIPEPKEIQYRTAYTVERSLRTIAARVGASLLATAVPVGLVSASHLPWLETMMAPSVLAAAAGLAGAVGLGVVATNLRGIWRVFRDDFLELPVDGVLQDLGRALLASLGDAGLVPAGVSHDLVRVVETPSHGYQVSLEGVTPQESDLFAKAFGEMIGPLGDARYLIERNGAKLRNLAYRPFWLVLRKGLGLDQSLQAYHRVPGVLASRRERAEALARHWRRHVGGGRLIYTRTAEGRRILLQARSQQRSQVHQLAFEFWR